MSDIGASLKRAIRRRIGLTVGKMLLAAIDDSGTDRKGNPSHQRVTGTIFTSEGELPAERLQDYGISSHPLPGAEGIALQVGGSRARIVVINTDDPRHRPTNLAQGELQIYTDEGPVLHAKRGRNTELRGNALDASFAGNASLQGATVTIDASSGDVSITGANITIGGKDWATHKHAATGILDSVAGPCTGSTGVVV